MVPLRSNDRRAPRHGFELRLNGQSVGEVTSGTFAPSLSCGIGLGYIPIAMVSTGLELEAGPRSLPLVVETAPLYKEGTGRNRIEIQKP